jgi:hypothetical protein
MPEPGVIRRWGMRCLVALLLFAPAAAFDRYCLGGDLDPLLGQGPKPQIEQTDGQRRALVFQEGPELIYVLAFRNRIYKVVRRYRAATQLRFDDLYGLLRSKYGPGEDQSQFPPYASTASRRLGSIRRGDGRAVHLWKPDAAWHVELTWTREMDIAVAFVANALNAEQEKAVEAGF